MALAKTALLIRANEAGGGEERSDQAAQLLGGVTLPVLRPA
jgi:hypothetical protein